MKGRAVRELCVQFMTHRPAHLATYRQNRHEAAEVPTTVTYLHELPRNDAYASPFRPHRVGTHVIRSIEITESDVLITCDGGTVRLPPEMVTYSFSE